MEFRKRATIERRTYGTFKKWPSGCGRFAVVEIVSPFTWVNSKGRKIKRGLGGVTRWLAIERLGNGNESILSDRPRSRAAAEEVCASYE